MCIDIQKITSDNVKYMILVIWFHDINVGLDTYINKFKCFTIMCVKDIMNTLMHLAFLLTFTLVFQRITLYGLGHGGLAVLLPGFAINW